MLEVTISALAAIAAGGFVWFSWNLVENFQIRKTRARLLEEARNPPETTEGEGAENRGGAGS